MRTYSPEIRKYLINCLRNIISEERWNKFNDVISFRTHHLTIILEDIFQNHNASAVIRTCELSGIMDLHIIENQNPYNINPDIVRGSDKWLNLIKYNSFKHNTLDCYQKLREAGYRVVATSPHRSDCLLEELPVDQKTALVFGNEGFGLTEVAKENADAFVCIPSVGFTESYNISVAVAICTYHLTKRLRRDHNHWQLSDEEKEELLLDYAVKSVRNPQVLLKRLLSEYTNQ
jgi:tRNA (guanosine-2'-O-)-methyltransferase